MFRKIDFKGLITSALLMAITFTACTSGQSVAPTTTTAPVPTTEFCGG